MKKLSFAILVIAFCQLTFGQVIIVEDDKVGIGTTYYLLQTLHVEGNTYLNGNLGVGVANSTQKLYDGTGLFAGNGLFNGSLGIGTTDSSQKLHVEGNTYLNGNVGIGVDAMSNYKLNISGDIRFNFEQLSEKTGSLIFAVCPHESLALSPYPTSILARTVYPSLNNSIYLGTADKRFARLYAYIVNHHAIVQNSDMRLKKNIRPCPPLLSKLNKVQSYNYNFTDEYFKDFSEEEKQYMQRTEYGFLAQEIQKIFPELVYVTDSTGMLGVNYTSMIPILTAGINEQQQLIEKQAAAIAELQKEVETLRYNWQHIPKPTHPNRVAKIPAAAH